jgi:hypothetical protein
MFRAVEFCVLCSSAQKPLFGLHPKLCKFGYQTLHLAASNAEFFVLGLSDAPFSAVPKHLRPDKQADSCRSNV